jgi:hypothetical protein
MASFFGAFPGKPGQPRALQGRMVRFQLLVVENVCADASDALLASLPFFSK